MAKVEFLPDGRNVRLLESVRFRDRYGDYWFAPTGAIVDGASIPRFFWRVIGSPFVGKYREASILHDFYCVVKSRPSSKVHRMFYDKMLADGVHPAKAMAMWLAVRLFGPRFKNEPPR